LPAVAGLRVNLGSGHNPLPGFLNVDALSDAPGVDLVADISQALPLDDGSAELVYASHVLEHFPQADTLRLLREWRRILQPGGELWIAVPDLELIARMLIERKGWFTPPNQPWLGAIYGGQKDDYDFHKTGFTDVWLAGLLTEAGFTDVRRVDRFEGIGRDDTSFSPLPFGANLSLNMIATTGGRTTLAPYVQPAWFERWFFRFDLIPQYVLQWSSRLRAALMYLRRRRIERSIRSQ
jgi:predicted SAM-dependent methyltransferase